MQKVRPFALCAHLHAVTKQFLQKVRLRIFRGKYFRQPITSLFESLLPDTKLGVLAWCSVSACVGHAMGTGDFLFAILEIP
jgi:hypothetical protein